MKTKRVIVLNILLIISFHSSFAQYDSIFHDGIYRTYLLRLPASYSEENAYPLVIAMHGGFGNANNLENQSQLSVKANADDFVVVYPEGVKSPGLGISSWNAGWCCGYASNADIDDVGFIDQLLDELIGEYSIDFNRVYATGMSNGGFMSYRLACELPDRIAAIAPVSCSMAMVNCTPERGVPVIHFHSFQDTSIPWEGGVGDGASGHHNPPTDSVLNAWAALNGCNVLNDTLENTDEYTHNRWSDCECGAGIELYITQDGGHSWHGGSQTVIGDQPSQFISATDAMWEFFQGHALDCEVTGLKDNNSDELFSIYPNPTANVLNFTSSSNDTPWSIVVFNAHGQLIELAENITSINLGPHPDGIYFVLIRSGEYYAVKKVIKTRH